MKLSHPIAIKSASLLLSWWLRLWMGSLQARYSWEEGTHPSRTRRPHIYMVWHENLLLGTYAYARDISALISQHRDGELIAQVVRMLRGRTVRGSTTRGGAAAVREILQRGRGSHLAITPDGPRGPRRIVQDGAVYLASRTGMPLVPVGVAHVNCWRARSWDRMALPRPGQRAVLLGGPVVEVPENLDREGLEVYRQIAQQAMDLVQARAEEMARHSYIKLCCR